MEGIDCLQQCNHLVVYLGREECGRQNNLLLRLPPLSRMALACTVLKHRGLLTASRSLLLIRDPRPCLASQNVWSSQLCLPPLDAGLFVATARSFALTPPPHYKLYRTSIVSNTALLVSVSGPAFFSMKGASRWAVSHPNNQASPFLGGS